MRKWAIWIELNKLKASSTNKSNSLNRKYWNFVVNAIQRFFIVTVKSLLKWQRLHIWRSFNIIMDNNLIKRGTTAWWFVNKIDKKSNKCLFVGYSGILSSICCLWPGFCLQKLTIYPKIRYIILVDSNMTRFFI